MEEFRAASQRSPGVLSREIYETSWWEYRDHKVDRNADRKGQAGEVLSRGK